MKDIKAIRYVNEKDKYGELADKMIVPTFFNMISDYNEYRVFEKFKTPLDILQDVLVFKNATYNKGDKNKEIIELLVKAKDLDGVYQTRTIQSIFTIIKECGKKINGLKLKTCTLKDKAKKTVEKKAKREALDKLKKLTPSEVTILNILKQSFGEKEKDKYGFKRYSMLTLNLLFMFKKIQVLKCFKNNNMDMDEVLIKINDDCDIDIFGEKYQKIERKDLL